MLPALAFIPINLVFDTFNILPKSFLITEPDFNEFIDYFESNFIGTTRKSARYKIDLWNQCDKISSNLCRTNNGVETWHE